MASVHFLTFGDGAPNFRGAAARLSRQAAKTGVFRSITCGNLAMLHRDHPEFWRRHGEFLLTRPFVGYYLWKPFLVSSKLSELPDGDFLVYADAGCEFAAGEQAELAGLLPVEPGFDVTIIPLESFHTMRRWAHRYCLSNLDPEGTRRDRAHFSAGILCFRNTAAARRLVERWLEWCLYDDCACLADRERAAEDDAFEAHRHDQSILCLVAYDLEDQGQLGLKRIDVFAPGSAPLPILGIRNRSPFSAQGSALRFRLSRKLFNLWVRLFWNEARYRARVLGG
ncbi:MAG TPA: hypothetical protein VGG57_08885 [Stellaceae bacterium]|jgi:hypothetical protein